MNTETTLPVIKINEERVVKHNLTISRINIIKDHASTLEVAGVKDFKGLKKVVKTRKFIKQLRLNVDKRRREINADYLREMRENNFAARYIINELKPAEKRLNQLEKDIAGEKDRIKAEKKRQELERLQNRINQLTAYECAYDIDEVQKATDEQFSLMLDNAKFNYEAAQQLKRDQAKRLAEENEKLKQENEKLKQSVAASVITQPLPVIEIHPEEIVNTSPAHIVETTNHVDISQPGLSDQEKEEIKLLVKNYALALQAVPVPDIKDTQSLLVFNNAHNQIAAGITMLLRAVE